MEVKFHGQIDLNEVVEVNDGHFPETLYSNLPGILRAGADVLQGNDREVYLVSALAAISSVLPNFQTIYDGKTLESNLYIFLLGSYGSGKGAANYAHVIVRPVHKALRETEPPPELTKDGEVKKQVRIVHFLPANSSKSGFIELLANNKNRGYIHETEADTLTTILKQDYGDFSDLIRAAYHHETVSFYRRKDNEYYDIEEPKLSILLTGTPGQLRKLMPNVENGLLSRFNFFLLESELNFKNVFDSSKNDLTRHFYSIGEQLLNLYKFLKASATPLSFEFTEPQQAEFQAHFQKTKKEIIETYGDSLAGNVNRFGVQFTRLAMLLTALRNFESGQLSELNYCHDIDFQNAKELMDVFIWHALNVYEDIANNGTLETLTEQKRAYYHALPKEFRTSEAVELAEQYSIAERTVKRFIQNRKLFENLKHGEYKKLK
jgi:hypothetical protein